MQIDIRKSFLRACGCLVLFVVTAAAIPLCLTACATAQATSATTTASAAPSAPAMTSGTPYKLGINMLWGSGSDDEISARFARMKSLGISEARIDWEWRVVEEKKGQYDWSALDRFVQLASKNGISIFPIVHYAPNWALPTTKKPNGVYQNAPSEAAFGDYARFLAASIDRYGPGGNAPFSFTPIKYWQVWNEPNTKEFWGPKPDARTFARMMTTVNDTLGDRRNKVSLVHAGLSKADILFMWTLWDSDPQYGRLFDIMAVHPYFFNPQGGIRDINAMDKDKPEHAALGFVGSAEDGGYLSKVFNMQLFMTLKGTPKPIWITEIGFMAGHRNPYAISEEAEAKIAGETLAFIRNRLTSAPFTGNSNQKLAPRVERVYWFTLDDYGFPDDTGNFGVYRMDGTPRPLADTIRGLQADR